MQDGAFDPPASFFFAFQGFWIVFLLVFFRSIFHGDPLRSILLICFECFVVLCCFLVFFASVHGQRTCTNTSMIRTFESTFDSSRGHFTSPCPSGPSAAIFIFSASESIMEVDVQRCPQHRSKLDIFWKKVTGNPKPSF